MGSEMCIRDRPGTLVVSILVAADTSSVDVGIPAMRTATTPLPTGNHITRVYWYIRFKYSVQQCQVYAMLVRGRTWYLYVLLYLVGYRSTAVCAVFSFLMCDLMRQGPCHGVACEIRIVWCIWVVLLETQVRQQCHFFVLAAQFDGTEGNLRSSNAPNGVRELHSPHAWGTC